jgi:hypothetical protein
MRNLMKLVLFLSLAASCGGGAVANQTDGFVGPWTFTSGTLMPVCLGGVSVPNFDLTGLPVAFTKVDDSTIKLVSGTAGCEVTFKVSGATATASPANQTCELALGGALTGMPITVNNWTLTISGDRIDSTLAGSVVVCMATGPGVLMRGLPDGGTD